MMKKIPQIEPVFDDKEKKAIIEYLDTKPWLMEHTKTEELEKMICKLTGAKYCSMVPNGTLSLTAGLVTLGIKPGDEVIVPDYTIIATATAASFIGAKPVFVDIEPDTFAIDIKHLKHRITNKTKAIILVSINARPARDWVEILEIAKKKSIPVIEDAAQCLGSYYNVEEAKVHMGTLGEIGSFSFSASKIISIGSGGAVITDSKSIHTEIELMKDFGREHGGRDINIYPGIDLKYTDLQAVVGIEQMKKLPARVKRKKEMYKLYKEQLEGTVGLVETDLKYTAPWLNDIMLESKDERTKLCEYLNKKGIGTRNFYPAIHTQKPFAFGENRFYVSTDVASRGVWLPSSMSLTDEDIIYVCDHVKKGLKND